MKLKEINLSEKGSQRVQHATFTGASLDDQISALRGLYGLDLSYQMYNDISIFANIVKIINDEVFRNGLNWDNRFILKCTKCGYESEESLEECPICKSKDLMEPESSEKLKLISNDKHNFLDDCNSYHQSFLEVLQTAGYHTEISNRCAIFVQKKYLLTTDKKVKSSVMGIYALDPRYIMPIFNERTGKMGGKGKLCPVCRKEHDQYATTCSDCGCELIDIWYRTRFPNAKYMPYGKDEILLKSKYSYELFGNPLCFRCRDELYTYHLLTRRTKSFYERGRTSGILNIQTLNQNEMIKQWDKIVEMQKADPYYIPLIITDPQARVGMEFVKLMQEPNADYILIKDELRQRIGSMWGVSPVLQNDTTTSGGLNNESQQLTVTAKAVESGQLFFNKNVIPWILKQFGINDWQLVLNPSEEQDEKKDQELLSLKLDNMKKAVDLGLDVTFKDGNLDISGQPEKQEPLFNTNQELNNNDPNNSNDVNNSKNETNRDSKTEGNKDKLENNKKVPAPETKTKSRRGDIPTNEELEFYERRAEELDEQYINSQKSHEDYINAQFPYFHCVKAGQNKRILEAIVKMPHMHFKNITPKESFEVYSYLLETMKKEKWSIKEISSYLEEKYGMTKSQAKSLAVTETHVILESARMLDYKDTEAKRGKKYKYRWMGPNDSHNTEICKAIKERVGEGVYLNELEDIIREESNKYWYNTDSDFRYRYMTPHYGCRQHARRVF